MRRSSEQGNENVEDGSGAGNRATLSDRDLVEQLTRLAEHPSVATLPGRHDMAGLASNTVAPSAFVGNSGLTVSQLLALQRQQGAGAASAVDTIFDPGNLYPSLGQPNLYQADYLRGAASLPNVGFPSHQPPLNLNLTGYGMPEDTITRLRREIAASNHSSVANFYPDLAPRLPPANAASAYLDFLAQRQSTGATLPSLHQLAPFNIRAAAATPSSVESFLAYRGLGGSLLNQSTHPYPPLDQHELLARLGAQGANLDSYFTGTNNTQHLERAEPTRFLAQQGVGAPNERTALETALSRNRGEVLSTSRQEGKVDLKDPPASTGATYKRDDPFNLDVSWNDLVEGSTLALPEHRGMVSDLHLAVLAQMKPCALTHEDRVGLYKTREIGFPGICCKHCNGVPGFGRYFPGSLTSLVNGNICTSIIKHINEECRHCPSNVRESILKLERQDELNPFHYKRGSRRQFFTTVWEKIQEGANDFGETSARSRDESEGADRLDADIPWDKILAGSEVVHMADRHLVPDTIFAATAQTKPCQVTEGDRVGRCKDHKLGSMGLCCKHCGGKEGAFGRYFPSNLHTFAQVEVCKQIVRHITRKCTACPPEIRDAILNLQEREKTETSKRFPSRMVFFRRVWERFHHGEKQEGAIGGTEESDEDKRSRGEDMIAAEDIPWERLVRDSTLVTLADQGLISDSQYAALAQMDKCTLTEEDRIGYNKDRDVGFVGLSCRFCGGRPGFGRYFPNTVRNFEKTSARETIVSHISLFCRKCPKDVRDALLSLKRIESSRDGSATMRALIYGSGKLFFRRVWSRLHADGAVAEEDSKPAATASSDLHHDQDVEGSIGSSSHDDNEESDESGDVKDRKRQPTQGSDSPSKRHRGDA